MATCSIYFKMKLNDQLVQKMKPCGRYSMSYSQISIIILGVIRIFMGIGSPYKRFKKVIIINEPEILKMGKDKIIEFTPS